MNKLFVSLMIFSFLCTPSFLRAERTTYNSLTGYFVHKEDGDYFTEQYGAMVPTYKVQWDRKPSGGVCYINKIRNCRSVKIMFKGITRDKNESLNQLSEVRLFNKALFDHLNQLNIRKKVVLPESKK